MTEGHSVRAAAARDRGAGASAGFASAQHSPESAPATAPGSAGATPSAHVPLAAPVPGASTSELTPETAAPANPAAVTGSGPKTAHTERQPASGTERPPGGGTERPPGGRAGSQGAGHAGRHEAGPTEARAKVTAQSPEGPPAVEPHVRVDARLIESAVLALRKPIVAATLPLEAPAVEQARAERRKLLNQIDDYLLPRLRESGAPILVALVGSTGAGKSTLVNSIVGSQVSMTGIRRPTTNSPVLACHPDDAGWFAENVFLPTVPRVRQEGLARSGRDGLLVLAANEGMPKGVALLDTPDIDSVVEAHHQFAHQFLDASDLWLFMTTASRYADATVWELLQQARDRGAALGLVLSRVPPAAGSEVLGHFDAMLMANGLGGNQRFVIPETVLIDGKLPPELSAPVREWMADAAIRADRRVAVLTQTMSGVLDTFRSRVPALAAEVEAQVKLRADLTRVAADAYHSALDEVEKKLQDGSLLSGEVLARWQDFAGTGDLLRALQARRGRTGSKPRRRRAPARAQALKLALRAAMESLVTSVADRAAEQAVSSWREHTAGIALLEQMSPGSDALGWKVSDFAADAGLIFGFETSSSGAGATHPSGNGDQPDGAVLLGRSSAGFAARTTRAVSGWQDVITRLVRAENVTKRSIARAVSLDDDSLATLLMVGLLGHGPDDEGMTAIPHRLLTSLFGAGPLRDIVSRARVDLRDRVGLMFDEEMLRFADIIDAAGTPDAAAALQLYQATYALEVAR
jgi:50S ribosome-binding GTPase